ncbi:aminoglycoside phosphotransferase [Paenibacillus baekrokdamisoli]|uniref:Aminoglycoside phosphotransferase n=1 Tax=Paenibacillus baekrokdamisoli TaxID=1712516 RepID=A0A3G9JGU6_9BACL|nr:phosphotransferase [Paenibacillus baekrokdamisoli]MBB3073292.1 Ser/Thr protein kinase RdoA (MazF antagonist) [Paenibacillus baekrokdamisoli]BBH23278.1 aminoglycoside phosphotransferase [Paenibacillus baekrokdamisoli]
MTEQKNVTDIQAHGMGTTLVRPDWAPITLEETNRLLRRYPGLGEASALAWHSPRPFSSATIAITAAERVFIKRHHHSVRDAEGLIEEHRFIGHLRSQGIPTSEVVVGLDGLTAYEMDEWTYEVHHLSKGTDLYRDAISWSPFLEEAHAYAAGEALARLHLAAKSFDAPARAVRALVSSFSIFASANPLEEIAVYIAKRGALSDYLKNRSWERDVETIFLPLHARLAPMLGDLRPMWTHNDWHASNLLWSDRDGASGVESILDFGLADRTNAVYDLATAIERNTIEWLDMDDNGRDDLVHYEQLEALLVGYESVRPLSDVESAALVAMLPLVHAEFALSEIDYFAGIVRSVNNADLAYDSFLVGHAKWFEGRMGRDLLDYLEQRHLRKSVSP